MQEAVAHRIERIVGAFLIGAGLLWGAQTSHARGVVPDSGLHEVALEKLPVQARKTYSLILQGGPFPYDKDGTTFGNRERLLPAKKRGYYREYTVATPRSRDRGARRIVCGGQQPVQPDACYYTSDHYNSFRKIAP